MELSHRDLSTIADFLSQLDQLSANTGIEIYNDCLWRDGEIIGHIDSNYNLVDR